MPGDGIEGGIEIGLAVFRDQGADFGIRSRLTEEQDDFLCAGGRQAQRGLQDAARIECGAGVVGQCGAGGECIGKIKPAIAADKFDTVAGPAGLLAVHVHERDAGAELFVPRIAREKGAGFGIERCDDKWLRAGPVLPQHPFDIGGDGETAFAQRLVRQFEARDLDGIADRHELQQVECNAVRGIFETAVTLAVVNGVGRVFFADRQGCGTPEFAAVFVAQIDRLARRIANRIVRPWCQQILLAVQGPSEAGAAGGGQKPEIRIGDHIGPGGWCLIVAVEDGDVFAAVHAETANTVEELKLRPGQGRFGRGRRQLRAGRRRCAGLQIAGAVDLLPQAAAVAMQNRAGADEQKIADVGRNEIGPEDVNAAAGAVARRGRPVRAHQRVDGGVEILHIGGATVVQDDEIDRKLFHAPVFVGAQQLMHQGQLILLADADEHDRQIAGDALRPQGAGAAQIALNGGRCRAQHRIGVKDVIGEALKQLRIFLGDAEVMKLHLRLRPGQRGGAVEGDGVVMLVGQVHHRIAAFGGHGPERDARGGAARNPHPAAQTEDGIEHRTGGVGKRPAFGDGGGGADGLAAADEAGTVGFKLHVAGGIPLHHRKVRGPDHGIAGRTLPPCGEDDAHVPHEFGFDEHLGEGGMGNVVRLPGERKFGVRGDFDVAMAGPVIGDGDAAHLGIVFRRDRDGQHRGHAAFGAGDVDAIFGEGHLIAIRLGGAGLIGGGPVFAAAHITQENIAAPMIAGDILAPAGERNVTPGRVAGAGGGDHGGEAAVRQQLCARNARMGVRIAAL